jgi:hypothetical protein
LKNQQYPEEIVEHGIQKALEKGPIHTELWEQVHVTSNQNNIIPFVTTYNPRDCNIFHFMKQIEFNLNSSDRMKNVLVLHDISCITAKVRPFLNVNEVPSIKLGHVIHLLSVHFLTDGDDSNNVEFWLFNVTTNFQRCFNVVVPAGNIPFNLASRIITMTNTEELRDTRLRELTTLNLR